jgi:serine/threonine protein kinase
LTLKRSMLEDVARGLLYLHKHTPQIVHRDLTAKNVLLTSCFVARITDFGNSRIIDLQPGELD